MKSAGENEISAVQQVRDQVRWVGAGSPLTHAEVDVPVHFTRIMNPGDLVNAIGSPQELAQANRGTPVNMAEHNMIRSYIAYFDPSMFWAANNQHAADRIAELRASDSRNAKFEATWQARAGLKPIITRSPFQYV